MPGLGIRQAGATPSARASRADDHRPRRLSIIFIPTTPWLVGVAVFVGLLAFFIFLVLVLLAGWLVFGLGLAGSAGRPTESI